MLVKSTEILIGNVLNQYYTWLWKLIGPKGVDKIALLSTITTHDIIKDARLFTDGVFRSFADRTITISPEDFGPGNTNDRYSRIYSSVISLAGYELYSNAKLTPEQSTTLAGYEGDITEAIREINKVRSEANAEWKKQAEDLDLKPNTPEWRLERANFYNPYLALIRNQREQITRAQAKKRSLWLSIFRDDRAAAQLSSIYERCLAEENFQYLPLDETIEKEYKLDPITIAEAAQAGLYPFERELGMNASGSLTRILDLKGARDVELKTGQDETHNHDSAWSASGSASWIPIFSASTNGGEEHHFRQSLSNIESIKLECDYIGDYWVRRRDWFDSTILENKYVQAELQRNPRAAALLAMCISSLVIVRGLRVTYKFKSVNDIQIWSSYNFKASGGFSVFGIDFGGVKGGRSGSNYDHTINTAENSITFSDGADVCRLLALRVSPILKNVNPAQIAFETQPLESTLFGQLVLEAWKEGTVPYGQLPPEIVKQRLFSEDTEE